MVDEAVMERNREKAYYEVKWSMRDREERNVEWLKGDERGIDDEQQASEAFA
jgi:hypothetical protein